MATANQIDAILPFLDRFTEHGFEAGTWFGLLAPAKTPPEVIDLLHRSTVTLLQEPAVRAKILEQGAELVANTPAEFRAFIKDETERLATVIRGANISLD